MRKTTPARMGAIFCLLLASVPCGADAESSCWKPEELKAYDITIETLMLAHVASDCDSMAEVTPPLRARLAQFLGHNGSNLDADRAALSAYYRRAYGQDWEKPLQASLDREETRVNLRVKQSATPDFCTGAAEAMKGLGDETWDQFVSDAQARQWHQKSGLPECR